MVFAASPSVTEACAQKLLMALHAKAKAEQGFCFYALYDKIILAARAGLPDVKTNLRGIESPLTMGKVGSAICRPGRGMRVCYNAVSWNFELALCAVRP